MLEYSCVAWGKPTRIWSLTHATDSTLTSEYGKLASLNPFRYRGYVWDEETGLYYLRSRYYDPEWGRFLNGDKLVSIESILLSTACFTYCRNSPITNIDSTGMFLFPVIAIDEYSINRDIIIGTTPIAEHDSSESIFGCCGFVVAGMKTSGHTPNSYISYHNGHGDLCEWWIGPDGKVEHSRHHTNHGNALRHPVVPHDHDWHDDDKGNRTQGEDWLAPDPRYKAPEDTSSEKALVGALLFAFVLKGAAILLAPATGGFSYALAAF